MLENFTNESLLNYAEYGYRNAEGVKNRLILSGSFAPIHGGHINLITHATKHYGKFQNPNRFPGPNLLNYSPCFELSKTNCDKPGVPDIAIIQRVKTITKAGFQVIVTNHPTFTQKNLLFRQSRFILGFDTLTRMLDLKHYYNSRELLIRSLTTGLNDYLVYPRGFHSKVLYEEVIEEEMSRFQDKPEFIKKFIFVPFDCFQQSGISSTEIRKQQNKEFSED